MFEEMADNDKARFQREKAEYNMNPNGRFKHSRFDTFELNTGQISLTHLTRSKRDPNAPKRPLCGFMYFSAEERGKVRPIRDVFPYVENLIWCLFRCGRRTRTLQWARLARSWGDGGQKPTLR